MAQQMRTLVRWVEAGPVQGTMDDRTYGLAIDKPALRCPMAHKHASCRAGRSAITQVVGNCLADFIRQWESVVAPALAAYDDFTGVPIEVIQCEICHFSGPQTQPGQ